MQSNFLVVVVLTAEVTFIEGKTRTHKTKHPDDRESTNRVIKTSTIKELLLIN